MRARLLLAAAAAEPTDVAVRVIAQGAKFIGGASGGARVLLHDAETGELLAEGRTSGGTGDTVTGAAGVDRTAVVVN